MVDGITPLPDMDPSIVVVKEHGDKSPLWPLPRRSRRSTRQDVAANTYLDPAGVHHGWLEVAGQQMGREDSEDELADEGNIPEDPLLLQEQAELEALVDVGFRQQELEQGIVVEYMDEVSEPVGPETQGAVASAVAPAPAAPAPPAAQPSGIGPRAAFGRSEAEAVFELPGHGVIRYHLSKNAFEARCEKHGCVLTRTSNPSKGRGSQGRPCGFLAAWLQMPGTSKEAHMQKSQWRTLSLEERREARRSMAGLATGTHLLNFEREKWEGEQSEPEDIAPFIR